MSGITNKPARNDLHPTMKPVELVERAIRNSSKSRDIVLDLFGGSGSTVIACEKSHRSARITELDPRYVDVIVRRWEEYTGKEAWLASNKLTFAQVKDDRQGGRKCRLATEEKETDRHGQPLQATGSD